MKGEEAIEILKERKLEPVMKVKKHIEYVGKLNTALEMAIEALKREDTMLKEIERVVLYGERGEA